MHLAAPRANTRRPPLKPGPPHPQDLGAHPLARGTGRARLSLWMSLKHAIPSLVCPHGRFPSRAQLTQPLFCLKLARCGPRGAGSVNDAPGN